jgi:hypothetical protein
MTTIVHHTDHWPIVISQHYGTEHSETTLQEAHDAWVAFMNRGQHVLILDLTQGNAGATAAQRRRMATWLAQNEALLKSGRQLAHVLVVNSAVVRGIITAVSWIRPPANPEYTAKDLNDAVDLAVRCLSEAGIDVDPQVVRAARHAGSQHRRLEGPPSVTS